MRGSAAACAPDDRKRAVRYGTDYENLPAKEADGALEYAFVEGRTMFDQIQALADRGDTEGIVRLLREFRETCFANQFETEEYADGKFLELFGSAGKSGQMRLRAPGEPRSYL